MTASPVTTSVTTARPVTPLGILAATLDDVAAGLEEVLELDPTLRAQVQHARALAGGLDAYVAACTTPESPALAELARRTAAESWTDRGGLEQEMLSGHVEGQVLKALVHLGRVRRVLDVGMFTGYSSLAMAEALPTDGEVVACELDAQVAALARRCFDDAPDGHKISVRVAPAAATLALLAEAGECFDLVFLDADKAGYLGYLEQVLTGGLLAEGGTVVVDNTLMQGQPWVAETLPGQVAAVGDAIAAFNAAVASDPRVEQVLLPVRDGITLLRRAA